MLKKQRKDAGLLQGELARRLGKPQSFVSRFEAGAVMLDRPHLRQVCRALGLSRREFVDSCEDALEQADL